MRNMRPKMLSMEDLSTIHKIRSFDELDKLSYLNEILAYLYIKKKLNYSDFVRDLRLNPHPVRRTLDKLEELWIVRIIVAHINV